MTKIVEVGDCVVGCVADDASDGELVIDSNTCQSDFDSRIACKRICQRVKSLDGLPSKRGKCSFSSLMIVMNFFFKQCNYQFTISLTSKEIDSPNVVLAANVALQITVVVEVLLTLVAARRPFGTTVDFLCTTSVFGRLEVKPQSGRTVARELTDAATSASDAVGRFADGLELDTLCAQSLPSFLELNSAAFLRGKPGDGVANR
jgi:hypothetical protein